MEEELKLILEKIKNETKTLPIEKRKNPKKKEKCSENKKTEEEKEKYSNYYSTKPSKREKYDLQRRKNLNIHRRCVSETLAELSKDCNFYYWTLSFEDRDIVEISKKAEEQLIRKYIETLRNAINSRLKLSNKSPLQRIIFFINKEATPGRCRLGYANTDHVHIILAIPKCLDGRFMKRCITGTEPHSYKCRKTCEDKTVEGCILHEKILKIPSDGLVLRSYLMTAVSGLDDFLRIFKYNSKNVDLNTVDDLDDYFTIL